MVSNYQPPTRLPPYAAVGVASNSRRLPNGKLIPAGYFAEGFVFGEPVCVWTDTEGKHFVLWGFDAAKGKRHTESEEEGANTASGAALCILREQQRRRDEHAQAKVAQRAAQQKSQLKVRRCRLTPPSG